MFDSAYLILHHIQYKKNVEKYKKYIQCINKIKVANKSIQSTNINIEKEEHNRCSICSDASTVLM